MPHVSSAVAQLLSVRLQDTHMDSSISQSKFAPSFGWRTIALLILSSLVGFFGFVWGVQSASHQCDKDSPVWKVGIIIFSAVSSGYSCFKIPRWYFKIAGTGIIFALVSVAGRIYLYEVHK